MDAATTSLISSSEVPIEDVPPLYLESNVDQDDLDTLDGMDEATQSSIPACETGLQELILHHLERTLNYGLDNPNAPVDKATTGSSVPRNASDNLS
jgi:hypothetical protein